jgi:hypothetical protein
MASSWLRELCECSGDFYRTISTNTRCSPCLEHCSLAGKWQELQPIQTPPASVRHLLFFVFQVVLMVLIVCAPAIRLALLHFNTFCEFMNWYKNKVGPPMPDSLCYPFHVVQPFFQAHVSPFAS